MPVPGKIEIKQLDLELNGGCNFKCKMCPQATGRERNFLKKLSRPVFEKIIEDAMQYGVESVSLHGSGEPTLNADMPNMVKFIKDRNLKCISFTNGYRLDEKLARRLIESGIDVLRISIIGFDAASYHHWMSMDAFERVRNNVKRFVELNHEMDGNTKVHLYHLVTDLERQEEEIAQYRKNWVDYTGALGEIWLMHNWSGEFDAPYHRDTIADVGSRRSCGRPFSPLLQVRAGGTGGHAGTVVACCMVLGKDSEAELGHLDSQSIREVVEGGAYEALCRAHTEKRFDDISYCRDCDQLYNMPEALVWSNIPGRKYGQSKVVDGVDHRTFADSTAQ